MLLCFKHHKPASSLDSECFWNSQNRRFFEKTKNHTTLEMTRSRHHCPILPFKIGLKKHADLACIWYLYVWKKVSCMLTWHVYGAFMYEGKFHDADLACVWFHYVWGKVSCMLTWHVYGSFMYEGKFRVCWLGTCMVLLCPKFESANEMNSHNNVKRVTTHL